MRVTVKQNIQSGSNRNYNHAYRQKIFFGWKPILTIKEKQCIILGYQKRFRDACWDYKRISTESINDKNFNKLHII